MTTPESSIPPNAPHRILPRIIPFILFMGFIGIEELARFLILKGFIVLSAYNLAMLYPVKTVTVAAALIILRREYSEFRLQDLSNPLYVTASIVTGGLVFVLWIKLDWMIPVASVSPGYNPMLFENEALRYVMIAFRVVGAVAVVPVMEELFWRSFLARYLINHTINNVPIGTFTVPSFLISATLFGLEHTMVVAGIMAGIFFNMLLYLTRSIALCTLAHAIANLGLAVYVLKTELWHFW